MLAVVSPAKSLDFESPLPTKKSSDALMLDRSAELVGVMRKKSPDDLAQMMSISPGLAELNFERFQDWSLPLTSENARPAVLAFNGDTYTGLDAAASFDARDFTHAQKTLRILSGLYGVLRPLDLMAPYRLEMGSKVKTPAGDTLYDFWGNEITEQLAADIEASPGANVLINLASNEYFSAVNEAELGHRVITPKFLNSKDGGPYKTVGFFAKRARGAMANWMIKNRVKAARAVTDFDGLGYRFDPERSSADEPAFVREN